MLSKPEIVSKLRFILLGVLRDGLVITQFYILVDRPRFFIVILGKPTSLF